MIRGAAGPAAIRAAARGIENKLPAQLDITFDEDHCRTRTDFSPLNLAIVRAMFFNILNREDSNLSLKHKRPEAS
jgi:predicted transposase YbfD/YdcC